MRIPLLLKDITVIFNIVSLYKIYTMKKKIEAIIKTYKSEKERLSIMLTSLTNYIEALLEPEYFTHYIKGEKSFPLNKTGNKYMDEAIEAIKETFVQHQNKAKIKNELEEALKFIQSQITKNKLTIKFRQLPDSEPVKLPNMTKTKAPAPTKEINIDSLNHGIINASKVKNVLDRKPINPNDFPSMLANITECMKNLTAFREQLLGEKTTKPDAAIKQAETKIL